MKFSIALIALLCVSSISSAPVSNKFCVKIDHDFVSKLIVNLFSLNPWWKADATLRENLLNVADKSIDAGPHVYWDEKLDAKTNLVILIDLVLKSNPIVDFDLEKSLESNVGTLVEFINNHSPFTLQKTEVLNLIVRAASNYGFEGIDAEKSLHENVVIYVEAYLKDVKVEEVHSFKELVHAVIIEDTDNFFGFGPDYTLQDMIAYLLEFNYFSCEYNH